MGSRSGGAAVMTGGDGRLRAPCGSGRTGNSLGSTQHTTGGPGGTLSGDRGSREFPGAPASDWEQMRASRPRPGPACWPLSRQSHTFACFVLFAHLNIFK